MYYYQPGKDKKCEYCDKIFYHTHTDEEIAKINNCQLCGKPMPAGEEVFNFHGYSGPCPK